MLFLPQMKGAASSSNPRKKAFYFARSPEIALVQLHRFARKVTLVFPTHQEPILAFLDCQELYSVWIYFIGIYVLNTHHNSLELDVEQRRSHCKQMPGEGLEVGCATQPHHIHRNWLVPDRSKCGGL